MVIVTQTNELARQALVLIMVVLTLVIRFLAMHGESI